MLKTGLYIVGTQTAKCQTQVAKDLKEQYEEGAQSWVNLSLKDNICVLKAGFESVAYRLDYLSFINGYLKK